MNFKVFEYLLFMRYWIRLSEVEKKWFVGDGKELWGSIEKSKKWGEFLV